MVQLKRNILILKNTTSRKHAIICPKRSLYTHDENIHHHHDHHHHLSSSNEANDCDDPTSSTDSTQSLFVCCSVCWVIVNMCTCHVVSCCWRSIAVSRLGHQFIRWPLKPSTQLSPHASIEYHPRCHSIGRCQSPRTIRGYHSDCIRWWEKKRKRILINFGTTKMSIQNWSRLNI